MSRTVPVWSLALLFAGPIRPALPLPPSLCSLPSSFLAPGSRYGIRRPGINCIVISYHRLSCPCLRGPSLGRHRLSALLPQEQELLQVELLLGAVGAVAPRAEVEGPVVVIVVVRVVPHQLTALLAARPASPGYKVLAARAGNGGEAALGQPHGLDEVEMRSGVAAAHHPPPTPGLRVAAVWVEVTVANLPRKIIQNHWIMKND